MRGKKQTTAESPNILRFILSPPLKHLIGLIPRPHCQWNTSRFRILPHNTSAQTPWNRMVSFLTAAKALRSKQKTILLLLEQVYLCVEENILASSVYPHCS